MNILGCRIGFVPLVMSYIDGRRFESANLLDSRSTGPDGNSSPISPSVKWHFARSDSIPS